MCRYAQYGPYKRHFACFDCRKALSGQHSHGSRMQRVIQIQLRVLIAASQCLIWDSISNLLSGRMWSIGKSWLFCIGGGSHTIHAGAVDLVFALLDGQR
jgi:hypothetical protein